MYTGPTKGDYGISFEEVTQTIPSTIVWSDDFNDGDISDWTVFGKDHSKDPPEITSDGNFSVADGTLRAIGPEENHAYIESSTAYGTWSFDVYVVDTNRHRFFVGFMSTSNFSDVFGVYDYALGFVTGDWIGYVSPSIALGWHHRSPTTGHIDWNPIVYTRYPNGIDGWYHIDITRADDDFFYVYINGTYAFGHHHDRYQESDSFHFYAPAGPAIDNVIVYDTTEIDLVSPVFDQAFVVHTLTVGENFIYDVNATDSSGIDTSTWSVNDTTNFAINSDGVITNAIPLTVGIYGIEVSIDDTWGNTATSSFTVTVETAQFDYTLIAIGGGLGIVVIVVAVLYLRKRGL